MASATIGLSTTSSFINGATIGAFAGFSGGFVGGAANAWTRGKSFGGGLMSGLRTGGIGALTGGLIGGVAGGINAVNDGRRFFDGATVQERVLMDRQIPFVRQQGDMNCGPANCEAISQSRGGNVSQHSIRNDLGGNPNTTPPKDADVFKEFSRQSGFKYHAAGRGLHANEALHYMRSGYDADYFLYSKKSCFPINNNILYNENKSVVGSVEHLSSVYCFHSSNSSLLLEYEALIRYKQDYQLDRIFQINALANSLYFGVKKGTIKVLIRMDIDVINLTQ